ncbi:MAG: flavodoxin-dependent (E)-4-hydroxy-3-methylbut-2-enyl-diphosphate synthase [Deltaproteobacteria bacterium]|nr:flavodoxin-dependent (E)-4-hydroxy-3-methylbut-2-enyl-diphosphate synthase [Deltaproteobacteria bacterium]
MKAENKRKKTKEVCIGAVKIGNFSPITVQSMTNTDTRNISATVNQIRTLEEAGCEIIRVAVPDEQAALALIEIKKGISIPLIADIHFDYRLALAAMRAGADGIRINPGNIPRTDLRAIIEQARERDLVIRIGVNAGSLEKELREKYAEPSAQALVESALRSVAFFEDNNFFNMKISIKSSSVKTMIAAYRLFAEQSDYPLHLGVTEAGSLLNAAIKSSIGIGTLLQEGIGDTLRVSITGSTVDEVRVAYGILRALDIRNVGVNIISCPTCGRCEIDVARLVREVEGHCAHIKEDITIALMGCVVNGIGEAGEADIGIAGGKDSGILFMKGRPVAKVAQADFVDVLMKQLETLLAERHPAQRS